MMKGGNFNVSLWIRFSLALAIIVFITIYFLWSSEQNPLASLVSSQEFSVKESSNSSKPLKAEKQNIDGFVIEKEGKKAKRNMDGLPGSANSSATTNKACNYAKGTWVADSLRPLYSGSGCKQWLSSMWACRLTKRADFTYEGYRWQPDACDMPEFIAPKFLERMQNKTIAFIGDSLGREQFQSLMCMVTGGEEKPEVENVGWKYGLVKPPGAVRPEGWAYRIPHTNTTILFYWSASLCNIEPINITDRATDYAMHLDRPPAFLSRFLHYFDVVVLNTGHHWNRGKFQANKWVMHMNGKPIEDKKLSEIGTAKNYTVYSNVKWLDLQIAKRPGLQGFFRTISPRHFLDGDWNTGGQCNNTIPLTRGSRVTQDESNDPVIARAVKGTKVKLLDITAVSELRDEAHISIYSKAAAQGVSDCLHWCLPGVPDTWNEILCAQIY